MMKRKKGKLPFMGGMGGQGFPTEFK